MKFTIATLADAKSIAQLHAISWQQNYRGVFSDEYLDSGVISERIAHWNQLLAQPKNNQIILLAKKAGQLCGFVCIFTDYHAEWGNYLDNLHVTQSMQGQGLGRQLMQKAMEALKEQNLKQQFYLWVFESNVDAQKFYDKIGGQPAGIEPFSLEKHGGGFANAVRYVFLNNE